MSSKKNPHDAQRDRQAFATISPHVVMVLMSAPVVIEAKQGGVCLSQYNWFQLDRRELEFSTCWQQLQTVCHLAYRLVRCSGLSWHQMTLQLISSLDPASFRGSGWQTKHKRACQIILCHLWSLSCTHAYSYRCTHTHTHTYADIHTYVRTHLSSMYYFHCTNTYTYLVGIFSF